MKKLLFISLLIYGLSAHAQTESSQFSIKLHTRLNIDREIGRAINLQGIYPALQIQGTKGFIHHIEISGISLGNFSFGNNDVRNFYLAAAYEFSIPLGLFSYNEDLSAYLGFGLSTSASSFFLTPSTANQFNRRGNTYVANFYLIPSLQRNITERLFFEFALVVNFGDVTILNNNTTDPTVPIRQQSFTQVNREFFNFEQFSFRFGFGIRL